MGVTKRVCFSPRTYLQKEFLTELLKRANELRSSIRFLLITTAAVGFLLGAFTRPTWQVSVESAQVLAGVVLYPAHNSFHIYHVKLWTILNQILAVPLALGISERVLSILVSGGISAASFVAAGLCTFAISRSVFWGLATPLMIHFTGLHESLSVNYPIEFMGTPHTYGVVGLAWSVASLSLFALELPIAGLFLGLAPSIHASTALWSWLIAAAVLLWQGQSSFAQLGKIWRWGAVGIGVSLVSLIVQWIWMAPVVPRVDPALQAQFVSRWVDFFDYHRQPIDFSLVGVQISIAALVTGICLNVLLNEESSVVERRLVRIIVVASIVALFGAAVSRVSAVDIPQTLLMLMPTRVFLVSNVMFFAALVGFLSRSRSSAICIVLCVLLLATAVGRARLPIVLAAVTVIAGTYFSRGRPYPSGISRRVLQFAGIVVLVVSLPGTLRQVRTAAGAFNAMSDRTDNRVFELASRTEGLLAIGSECCVYTQLRTRRPLLVEVQALDQITYAPESAPDMNEALKAVYGVDLLHPQESLRSANLSEDLTPVAKPLWEGRDQEEWKQLARTFGFTAVLANAKWKLNLPELARDSNHVLYRIPQ